MRHGHNFWLVAHVDCCGIWQICINLFAEKKEMENMLWKTMS